jgi:hypothetical protein
MKLSFEGVRHNALRQFQELINLAHDHENYDEEKHSFWAIECCISSYHDCLLALMKGDADIVDVKDFLLAFKAQEEIKNMPYCGKIVSFSKEDAIQE